jgi:hypothetical protein
MFVVSQMVAVSSVLSGASYATSGTVAISGPTYIIPVSAINAVLSPDIGTGDAFERLLYGFNQALYLLNDAGTFTQTTLNCESSNKSITKGVYETSTGTYTTVNLVNFLTTFNFGTNSVSEDASNLQVA